ncbi:NUDIX domain-containing protein [Bacillus horti]|uniref:8-oxo-dGTP diphosphatase n=1 Tax=Caldalkalibacillus horti TaxID=77523 RepID=A0ABT9W4I7_9BACI|nr:NUDIX domain-containing protein [Bacillus horti]MDQ0168160.1 8-oxo-dGTP diphosphatase [Bacillus horti]
MKLKISGTEHSFQFKGAYDHQIKLTLFPKAPLPAGHVVVLAFYQDQLLFTKHKKRGLEWPGGKVEPNEQPVEAAIRELYEETGGLTSEIYLVGQYEVSSPDTSFMKNVYVCHVQSIETHTGIDTEGAILLPIDVEPSVSKGFSALVLDPVFEHVLRSVVINPAPNS